MRLNSKKINRLRPTFIEHFPDQLEPGVLYVSMKYAICAHSCACGCGHKVITPLSPTKWKLIYDGETVTLYPSIGNYGIPCQSHYFLTKGRVEWVDSDAIFDGTRKIDEKKKRFRLGLFRRSKERTVRVNEIIGGAELE